MRIIVATALLTMFASAAPAQQVVENDQIKVFDGQWVQSKAPSQDGLLMYLTEQRARAGEYFSIRCEGADRSVRLGFSSQLPQNALVTMLVDNQATKVTVDYTGQTTDQSFAQGAVHGYKVGFQDDAAREAFLGQLATGGRLAIGGQKVPVDLKGAGAALREQSAYCR